MRNKSAVLIFSCLMLAFTSCKEDALPPVDDDLVNTPSVPVEDTAQPFMTGTLYYFNIQQTATNGNTFEDNLVRRFTSSRKWNGEILQKGDCFLINEEEIPDDFMYGVLSDKLLQSFQNGALFAIDGGTGKRYHELSEKFGTFSFFGEKPTFGNDETKVDSIFQSCGRTLWLIAGYLPKCRLWSNVLMPLDENGNNISDYSQGEKVSLALNSYKADCASPSSSPTTRAQGDDLLSLASAYKIIHSFSMTLNTDEYYELKEVNNNRSSTFQLEYFIYPMFSEDENMYYYYIQQIVTTPFSNYYIGIHNCDIEPGFYGRYCEFYGRKVRASFYPQLSNAGIVIHSQSPATSQQTISYTSGVSFSLAGTVGFSTNEIAGFTASVSGGISVSNSTTFTAEDITVKNLTNVSSSSPKTEWEWELRPASYSYKLNATMMTKVTPPSLTGQTTLIAGTDFIISAPPTKNTPFSSKFYVELESTAGTFGMKERWRSYYNTNLLTIRLPQKNK